MKLLQALVLISVSLVANVAFACSCVAYPELLPTEGATGVPTNVVLRALYGYASSTPPVGVSLYKVETLETVELTPASGPTAYLRSFTPNAPLEPMTQYRFIADDVVVNFTTGAGEDHEAPGAVQFQSVKYRESGTESNGSCGVSKGWALQFTGGDDAQTPREQLLVFAQTSSSDELADATGVVRANDAELSVSMCRTNFTPPKGSFPLSLQVVDLAGNASVLSTSKQASSCATAPGLLGVLALLWLRRRFSSARG